MLPKIQMISLTMFQTLGWADASQGAQVLGAHCILLGYLTAASTGTANDICLQSGGAKQMCPSTHLEDVWLVHVCGVSIRIDAVVNQQLAMPGLVEECLQTCISS